MTTSSPSRSAPARQLLTLTRTIAWSEFKLRYADSVLGYAWSLAKPLMLFGVMYTVFYRLLRLGEGVERFPEMLLLGIVLWSFFVEATSGSVTILVARADLLRKVSFPAAVLPCAVAATASLAMVFNLVAVMGILLYSGITPTIHWLWLPLLLAELGIVTVGVSLVLSALYVNLRDIGQVWDVLSQMLFYATPIIYPIALIADIDERLATYALLNPVAQIIEQAKRIVVLGTNGSLGDVLPGALALVPPSIALALLGVGIALYRRSSWRMVEQL